jgi:NADH-quinone oxidoreductase subunit J
MSILFYILATISVITGLGVILAKSPINSVLLMVVCFLTIAGQYILLNAQFLAVVHVIVYMGAILVLFLFVIMLLNLNKTHETFHKLWIKLAALLAGGLLFLVLLATTAKTMLEGAPAPAVADLGLVQQLGMVLYRDYLFPFEASSVLFLAAMVGVVLMGKREPKID